MAVNLLSQLDATVNAMVGQVYRIKDIDYTLFILWYQIIVQILELHAVYICDLATMLLSRQFISLKINGFLFYFMRVSVDHRVRA